MKKIKAKRMDNGEWVYGYCVEDCGDGCHEICYINSVLGVRIAVDPATVRQYIGLTDKEAHMNTNTKPRICEVLGVEVGERFTIDGYPTDYGQVQVCEDGKVRRVLRHDLSEIFGEVGHKIGSNALYYLLNHPDLIIRQPRFTEDEMATMRVLSRVGVTHIVREENGELRACEGSPKKRPCTINGGQFGDVWVTKGHGMASKLFPSLLPGQSIYLLDVIEKKVKNHE